MNKIEQIKAEIERLKNEMVNKGEQAMHDGEIIRRATISTCSDLLSFIDSLPEETSVDLEEETIRIEFRTIADKCFNEGIDGWEREKLIARHFANWQKEQMLKEAVEYEVWDFSSSLEACPHVNIPLDNKQYRNGDKVRIIILPKED